jgi:hypothetical protein
MTNSLHKTTFRGCNSLSSSSGSNRTIKWREGEG